MEYAICRGMEINRLSSEQEIQLQTAEKNKGRCFYPFEIQDMFALNTLKITYGIPEHEGSQATYNQKLRQQFYNQKLFSKYEHMGILNIPLAHEFDSKLRMSNIEFIFSEGTRRKRASDGYKTEENKHWDQE